MDNRQNIDDNWAGLDDDIGPATRDGARGGGNRNDDDEHTWTSVRLGRRNDRNNNKSAGLELVKPNDVMPINYQTQPKTSKKALDIQDEYSLEDGDDDRNYQTHPDNSASARKKIPFKSTRTIQHKDQKFDSGSTQRKQLAMRNKLRSEMDREGQKSPRERNNQSPRSHASGVGASSGYYSVVNAKRSNKSQIVPAAEIEKLQKMEDLHTSMIKRRPTGKWERGQGAKGNLSYLKMRAIENSKHPRQTDDGRHPAPIPICISIGRLATSYKKEKLGLDQLGIASSIYFKLLKSLIIFFLVCSLICAPFYYIYSNGDMSSQATSDLQKTLSFWTLGNLGEASYQCQKRDLTLYDTINLWCPSGTSIRSLLHFGIQKEGAGKGDNQCPQTVGDTEEEKLILDLDEECDLVGLQNKYPDYYNKIITQFKKFCVGKESCDMFVRNVDWPVSCGKKIGVRLEVITIPITTYFNITTTVQAADDDLDLDLEETDKKVADTEIDAETGEIINTTPAEGAGGTTPTTDTGTGETTGDQGKSSEDSDKNDAKDSGDSKTRLLADATPNSGADSTPKPGETNTGDGTTPTTNPGEGDGTQPTDPNAPVEPTPAEPAEVETTTTVSSYTEYKKAYNYVISKGASKFFLYAHFECTNENIVMHGLFEGEQMPRTQMGIYAVLADIGLMSILLMALWVLKYLVKLDAERHKKLLFETSEFSIVINNLPLMDANFTIEQLKAELWDHLVRIMKEQPQQIEKLRNCEESRACEIVDIQFAMSDYQYLNDVVAIKKLSVDIEKLDMKLEELDEGTDDVKIQKYFQRKESFLHQIDNLKTKYFKNLELMGQDNQIISAFVVFRSMEGVERVMNAFDTWRLTRVFFGICSCCTSQKQKSKLFKGRWLKVKRGIEPELLIWENFGVTRGSRLLRIILYIIFVIFMLLLCFYIVYILEQASNDAENQVPDLICPKSVDAQAANLDFYNDIEARDGSFHCFCKNLLSSEGQGALGEYLFPLDNEAHCSEWLVHYLMILAAIGGIAVLIIIGNVVVEVLIHLGAKHTRPVDEQEIITNGVRAVSWIQYINLGLVLFVINMYIKIGEYTPPAGILQGEYEDFTAFWYIDVGTQIIFAMILEIGAPHIVPMILVIYYGVRRCWDRRGTCDKRQSRKVLQSEYEEINTGPEFHLDARLAQIIAFVWTTFMYSSGLPILFIITAVNFFLIYWVDKILILRFYRTPKNFDKQVIDFSLDMMKWAFLFHFLIGAIVFSNDKILSTTEEDESVGVKQGGLFNPARYNTLHVMIFIVGNVFIMLLSAFESTIFQCLIRNVTCFKDMQEKFEEMDAISDDYYNEIHLKFLVSEYERSQQEKQEFTAYIDKLRKESLYRQNTRYHQQTQEQHMIEQTIYLNTHIKRLTAKQREIQAQFRHLSKLLKINDTSISGMIKQLQVRQEELLTVKQYQMKSKVQSYDIRDCDQYYGVLELEALLKKSGKEYEMVDYDQIRRSSSKVYTPGASFKGEKQSPGGDSDPYQPGDTHMKMIKENSSFQSSELDDILLDSDVKKGQLLDRTNNPQNNTQGTIEATHLPSFMSPGMKQQQFASQVRGKSDDLRSPDEYMTGTIDQSGVFGTIEPLPGSTQQSKKNKVFDQSQVNTLQNSANSIYDQQTYHGLNQNKNNIIGSRSAYQSSTKDGTSRQDRGHYYK